MRDIRHIKKNNLIISASIIVLIIVILLAGVTIVVPIIKDNAQKIAFEDERMAREIAIGAGVESVDEFRVDDLDKVKSLDIRYTGFYDTISDIEKCQQLSYLVIGQVDYGDEFESANQDDWPGPESKEKIQQTKRELGNILEKCTKLRYLYIIGEEKYFELGDLEFLENGQNLKSLSLRNQPSMDYSAIAKCSQLEHLSLYGCDVSDLSMLSKLENLENLDIVGTNVSEAKDILNVKKLKVLYIADTPLEENEEQLALIYQQFPDIEISNFNWKEY